MIEYDEINNPAAGKELKMKTNLLGRRIAAMVLVVMLLSTLTTLFVSANNNTDVNYSYTYSSSIDTCWTATRSKTDSSSHNIYYHKNYLSGYLLWCCLIKKP